MARYYIYRTSNVEGQQHWGEREELDAAKSYAETVFRLYGPEGDLHRPDDPLIKVAVVDSQSGEAVYEREVEK